MSCAVTVEPCDVGAEDVAGLPPLCAQPGMNTASSWTLETRCWKSDDMGDLRKSKKTVGRWSHSPDINDDVDGQGARLTPRHRGPWRRGVSRGTSRVAPALRVA